MNRKSHLWNELLCAKLDSDILLTYYDIINGGKYHLSLQTHDTEHNTHIKLAAKNL